MQNRAATTNNPTVVHEGVVCPFCSLLCDDLKVAVKNDRFELRKNGCRRATKGFQATLSDGAPRIDGKAATFDAAIERAAGILRASQQALIGGLGSDVDGLRATHRLAEKAGASLDHMHSAGLAANVGVLQRSGWYTTTLGEVRNRADVILIVGADCVSHYERFVETCLEPGRALAAKARRQRRVVYLGPKGKAPKSKKLPIDILDCPTAKLAEVLSALRAAVLGRSLQASTTGGISRKKLLATANALNGADYATIVWAAGHFEANDAGFCIETLSRLIADLNRTTRAAGLSLGGDDGGMSAMSVSGWLTGYPLGVSYANKSLNYEPNRIRTDKLIANQELDALLWLDAFGVGSPPNPGGDVPLIVIGHPNLVKSPRAEVAIPIGLPGVHHDARLFRTDSAVTMPLTAIHTSTLPTARQVVEALCNVI